MQKVLSMCAVENWNHYIWILEFAVRVPGAVLPSGVPGGKGQGYRRHGAEQPVCVQGRCGVHPGLAASAALHT
ncbi:hypothetical protein O3G_MSEX000871 [Manduca sexta]|nr:hypothetical protein O3G_MSEX000871 [Manduca sexta]